MAKRPKLNTNETAYQQAVRDAFQQWARDERKFIGELKDNLTAYRNQILADIPDEGTWAASRRQQTLDMLDDARATLDAQLSRTIVGAGNQAVGTALLSVEAPLSAFGMNVAAISRQLPLEQIGFLQRTAPTLITNVSAQVHTDVGALLQRYMAGGIRRQDLIRQIGSATGALPGATMKPGQIIPRAERRAQTILRTEVNAVSSIVQQHRIEELSAADKGVGSRWVHFPSRNPRPTHEALHGVTIFPGHGERFELSGVKITGPHDPALGAADRIECHCKVSTVYDPTRSDSEVDVHVGAAQGSAVATAQTPKAPEPKAKPVAKAKKAPKPAAPDPGPVTVSHGGAPAAGSKVTTPALTDEQKAAAVRSYNKGKSTYERIYDYDDLPASARAAVPTAKIPAKKMATQSAEPVDDVGALSDDEMRPEFDARRERWMKKSRITQEQWDAVDGYQGQDFEEVNGSLRFGWQTTPRISGVKSDIDAAFRNAPEIGKKTAVYRTAYLDEETATRLFGSATPTTGAAFADEAYMSTSLSSRVWQSGITEQVVGDGAIYNIRIILPSSSRPLVLPNYADEFELLVDRSTKLRQVGSAKRAGKRMLFVSDEQGVEVEKAVDVFEMTFEVEP